MGFLDGLGSALGKAAGAAYKGMQEKNEIIFRYKAMYERYDTEKLMRMHQETSRNSDEKLAIRLVLKDRGYGNQ